MFLFVPGRLKAALKDHGLIPNVFYACPAFSLASIVCGLQISSPGCGSDFYQGKVSWIVKCSEYF